MNKNLRSLQNILDDCGPTFTVAYQKKIKIASVPSTHIISLYELFDNWIQFNRPNLMNAIKLLFVYRHLKKGTR